MHRNGRKTHILCSPVYFNATRGHGLCYGLQHFCDALYVFSSKDLAVDSSNKTEAFCGDEEMNLRVVDARLMQTVIEQLPQYIK